MHKTYHSWKTGMECDEDGEASVFDPGQLVHKQLRDVAEVHKRMLLSAMNSGCRDGPNSVQSQKELQNALTELESERSSHRETKSLLQAEELRRDFAEGEVEILKAQMERERKQYEECLERLRTRASEESAEKSEIESQCSVIAYERQRKEDQVHLNEAKIRDLRGRLTRQKKNHRRQLDEANVRIQQEAYISNMVAQKDKKK